MYIRVGTGHNMAWGDCHYYVYQKRKWLRFLKNE